MRKLNLYEYRQLERKKAWFSLTIYSGPSQARDCHLGSKLLVDIEVYVEIIRRGGVLLYNSY